MTSLMTQNGSASTTPAGTVTGGVRGTGWVPVAPVPADVTIPVWNRDHLPHGTVTGPAGHDGSTVPVPEPVRAHPTRARRNRRNHGTVEPGHGSTVPVPAGEPRLRGKSARTWLTIVVAVVAALGQVQTARAKHFTNMIEIPWVDVDLTPWLAVAVFDLSVAALLYGGRAVIRQELSPWPFWTCAAGVAGISIYTNTQHPGAWITASASLVLFVTWFLTLYFEYQKWRLDQGHLADAAPRLLLSRLTIIDWRLAYRAWAIASTRSLPRGVAHRVALGEEETSVRDLAVLAGRLYLDVLADQMVVQLAPAGESKIRWWQRRARRAAVGRAVMTAADTVDHFLGLPVIERTGIRVGRISYATPDQQELPPPPPPRTPPADAPKPATAPRIPATLTRTSTGIPVVSAPPATTPTSTKAVEVPEVPAEMFEEYADLIALVQSRAGDAWWKGEKPLSVEVVQRKYGIGNRTKASNVARCLRVLYARKRADET